MKKLLFLLIVLFFTTTLYGCHSIQKIPFLAVEKSAEEELLNFKIEKIILSKSFQSIEPNVEILKKGNNLKLLASLGIVESSGIVVDKITKSENNINIYIDKLLDKDKVQLAVPQIIVELNEPIVEKTENLNFNIINQNYEPIHLKFNKKQILNNIYSQFKVSATTAPVVSLTKFRDEMIWNISFQNIYDKENSKSPLIKFNIQVDANTGEILDSKKDTISSYIDHGHLLDYIPNSHILYKQQYVENDSNYQSLWNYNIETKEKNKIYTSKNKIQSALFSPNKKYSSILEVDENKADLYIVSMLDNLVYKITPTNYLQPRLMKWKDENTLYFVNVGNHRSTLLTYDINDNISKPLLSLDFRVVEFDTINDTYVFVQEDEDLDNKKIYITKDGIDLKEIDMGFKTKFIDSNTIVYLKHIEKEDKNILQIYDIGKDKHRDLDYNISNYLISNDNIVFIEKNTCNSDFSLYKYNLTNGYLTPIANVISDKIFYNETKNIGYIELNQAFEDNGSSMIHSIDLKKLAITN